MITSLLFTVAFCLCFFVYYRICLGFVQARGARR